MTSKQDTNSQPIELQFHVQPDAWLPVGELLSMFHPQNSQTRNRAEMDAIKRHLSDEGFTAEMIVVNPWNKKIVSGHGRTQAAHELGFTGSLPVVYRQYETEAEHRRAMLRWNLARGHQDEAKEAAEFAALLAEFDRVDLAADFGLEEGEFEALLKEFAPPAPLEDPGPQTNRAEELREKWQVESGQLWQLGAHRLICGDCTDAAVVERVMGGEKADMVFTDPPFATFASSTGKLEVTDFGMIRPFYEKLLQVNLPYVKMGHPLFICCDWRSYPMLFGVGGIDPKNLIVWVHGAMRMGTANFRPQHEFILYALNSGFGQRFTSKAKGYDAWKIEDRSAGDVWQIGQAEASPSINRIHISQKPVSLSVRGVEHGSLPGGIVADWFSGSGSTLMAAEMTGRKCRAIEIAPTYVATALQRWADMTGQTPELLP